VAVNPCSSAIPSEGQKQQTLKILGPLAKRSPEKAGVGGSIPSRPPLPHSRMSSKIQKI